jgi:DNA-binding SARP family transcriptional activator
VKFRILGPLEVEGSEGEIQLSGGKQRALLAHLLLHANEVVPAGRLVDVLWADDAPADAAKALQVQVSRLRRALASDVLRTRSGGYLLAVDDESFDLRRFEERASAGHDLLAQGDAAAARGALGDALELWRGAPLAELAADPFVQPDIARLEELRLGAIEDRVEADLLLGAHAQLAAELEALVARHPLRERLRGQLMLALYRNGRQAEALAAYRDARHALVDELGIEPGKPLQELEQAILRQDSSLDLDASTEATTARPGRRAAGAFVGRDRELRELLAALDDAASGRGRLFLISGESGIGKTRLVDEVASRAKDLGALVLWGRCSKRGGAPPYWPWTQALRALGEDVPELDSELKQEERFRLFVEVASRLKHASSRQPLLLVFDDVQHSDELSLLLLEFVAGELAEMHLALVGTYVESTDVPAELAAFADHAAHHHLRLGLLGLDDVGHFLELTGAAHLDAGAVHAETGGNPRLVWQRVR